MTIFISGKITGDENYKEKFKKAKDNIRKFYPEAAIISPTDIELFNMTYIDCLDVTLKLLEKSDIIYMLPDWRNSHGAKKEYNMARRLNKEIRFYEGIKKYE